MAFRRRRSALYLPASNTKAIAKAREIECDVVILDLEDAVAPDVKDLARRQAADALETGGFGSREVVIRLNGAETAWAAEDLAMALAAKPAAILVPKVSDPADLDLYEPITARGVEVWAMIETCSALMNLAAIGRHGGAQVWVVGANDLAKEMRCRLDRDRRPLQGVLSQIVAGARANGLDVLDGVFNDLDDDAGCEVQCRQGLDFGFDGKTLVHPRQVPIANRAFSPDTDEVEWSRKVIGAFAAPENQGKGVLRLEGRLVERLHLDMARRALAMAGEAVA